jgi:hypothetical protein
MSEKEALLELLVEEFNRWEELLAGLSIEQITEPALLGNISIKDTVGHLRAWQQRSIARLEAALSNQEPQFPVWPEGLDPEDEDVDQINAWIQSIYEPQPWGSVYPVWKHGFLRFIELAQAVPEQDLFDAEKYPWLYGHTAADVIRGSYEHHHDDHYEPLIAWLQGKEGSRQDG